jgi:hypothetical protein
MAETIQKPKGLAAKMAAAMGEIGRVQKRGHNQAQGYKYARADDVAEEARAVLSKYGIAVYPDVLDYGIREVEGKNGKIRITWAKVAWTFSDAETGESRTINVPGEGQDSGDKGIYKAITGSMKYVLMAGFLIPTGEGDPEHDEDEKPATGKPKAPAHASDDAAAKVKAAMRTPAFRKQEAIREIAAMGLDVRATVKDAVGRTFPEGQDIKLHNEEELEKLERHVVLLKAKHNDGRAQAAH